MKNEAYELKQQAMKHIERAKLLCVEAKINPDQYDLVLLEVRVADAYRMAVVDRESVVERPQTEIDATTGVEVYRGCEIVGGKFEYKVKVKNGSSAVITDVTVTIVAYPEDCLELAGEGVKTISRIEVGGFRSPLFVFVPTKDCVEGKIVASVSFMDYRDQPHTLEVRPYVIRSVCDLLKPIEVSTERFTVSLEGMEGTTEETLIDWNPVVLFERTKRLLVSKNFHVIDSSQERAAGQFVGTLRAMAEGKYTGKRIAIIVVISGMEDGESSLFKVEALGDDIAMIPTTIEEVREGLESWTCIECGGPLTPQDVTALKSGMRVECRFCSAILDRNRYMP